MLRKKYQNGGINERQYFANYLKEAEGTDAYMKQYPSLIKKEDGTYYKALEDGIYYPYKDIKGKTTIGYGRHNPTVLKDYPKGISASEANTFLLEDIDTKHDLARDQFNNLYGTGKFDELSERERYMVTNYTFNPGSIYKDFSGALLNKDAKTAKDEYKIYTYTNKGKDNEKRHDLGRNKLFFDKYLKDWMYNTNKTPAPPVPKDITGKHYISGHWYDSEEDYFKTIRTMNKKNQDLGLPIFPVDKQNGGLRKYFQDNKPTNIINPFQPTKEKRWPGYDPDMERRLEKHRKILKKRQNPSGENSPWSYPVDVPMDEDLAKYLWKMNEWNWQNPPKVDPNDPNAPNPWQELQMGGSRMSNPSMYQRMTQLPGGIMQQIPGSNAVEFKGQTHKQGGILMDAETEVEDGETMDKVIMKNGQNEDYFFSSYLKKGGRSYSDIHKEILSRGGNQSEINYLAAMQEKAAKRKPDNIAKLGGVSKYATGGEKKESKEKQKALQKDLYRIYIEQGGDLSFRKWNKQNPFDPEAAIKVFEEYYNLGGDEPTTTIGLRQDLKAAYGYREDAGDGYTICQSGNCQDGTGVMYTYYKENLEETDNPVFSEGTVIGMYEGEFKDGKPVGQGKFTFNNVEVASEQNTPFVAGPYYSEGEFNLDAGGHPELSKGIRDFAEYGVKTGIFTDGKLTSGYEIKNNKTTNYEDGEKVSKFSKDTKNNLVEQGLLEAIPFKYSQGEINPKYTKMDDYGDYTQPTEKELNELGYSSHDEFRADYERLIDGSYDWKNVDDWGKQHEDALTAIKTAKDFTRTGTYTAPVEEEKEKHKLDARGPVRICPCAPIYTNYTVPEGVKCFNCKNVPLEKDTKLEDDRDVNIDLGAAVPWETYLAGAAQLVPAAYALTHNQPDPEMVPFEPGVTSPIVPGRLRAEKLSHINMNLQRSINDANLREMNQYIDTSGGGPANMINRMVAWGQKHEGDMQIAAAEKQANIGIENQNVAIANQTNLHNLKMEQEAALGNAQMQQAEAQRLNEVNAINTAARNKVKDDEEYMKYAGIIAGAQGIGSLFGDMLSYKGDRTKAKGYGIMGTTERMFLRKNLGKTLYYDDGSIFCENCTEADIAKYYNASRNQPVNVLDQ